MAELKKGPIGAEDVQTKDSGTSKQTFARLDSEGRTMTLSKIDAAHLQFRSLDKFLEDLVDGGYDVPIDVLNIMLESDVAIAKGTGSPETVVTANPGSLFLRTDGGEFTTLYLKASGTDNTGWVTANGNADNLNGFHASQSPTADEIPVLDSVGVLNLPLGTHLIGTNKILNESNALIDKAYTVTPGIVTVTAAGAEILTYDFGTVTAGDLILLTFNCDGTKGGTTGINTLILEKKSGTASLDDPVAYFDSREVQLGSPWAVTLTCILKISGSGTLIIKVTGDSAASDTSIAAGDAWFKPVTLIKNA